MIEKKRLEELIEQGAIIYEAKYHNVEPLDLSKRKFDFISSKYNMVRFEPMQNERWKHHKYLDKLFETKEEAEWELEFGNITRTETLRLPNFEEFMLDYKRVYKFNTPSGKTVKINGYYDEILKIHGGFIDICVNGSYIKDWDFSKENYLEACKIAKKLFLGEEV